VRSNQIRWMRVAVALATLAAASAPVHADPERRLLILIDASGSMATSRPDDGNGATRFAAARSFAKARIGFYEKQVDVRDLKVAVYTFQGDDALPILHTDSTVDSGFADRNVARHVIDCLTDAPDSTCSDTPDLGVPFAVGGNTPLARGMCKVVNLFSGFGSTDAKYLQVSSDGEENSSLTDCHGPTGVLNAAGTAYDPADSWQNQVISAFTGTGISAHTDLFEIKNLPMLRQPAPDPEGVVTPEARAFAATPSASTGLTPLEQFFTLLAQVTGGSLTVIHDDEPLPLIGDFNGDRCVDHHDAIPVARGFGPVTPPRDGTFDLNSDHTVDFVDYLIQLSLIDPTCGPDPFVHRDPVVCKGAQRIVIDGQSIEDAGITIDARGSCEITIRNSLIVSGKNAIVVVGSAVVTVDNSVIVGQNAVLVQHGSAVLSAAKSVFHGKLSTQGAFQFIDRGDNVFE
jgi:hypothetical protein